VQHPDGAGVRGEDLVEALVGAGRLVGGAAAQLDPAPAERLRRRPAAAVRLIARPAPWTVEYRASALRGESTPPRITLRSPMVEPTKPRWPGRAGVAPLRTTQKACPSCCSGQASRST
jgi:hypothetical protein